MEVSLLEASGLPPDCLISVRAGTTRRQAPAGHEFRLLFPRCDAFAGPVKVDFLQPLGSALLHLAPGTESYSLDVGEGPGGAPQHARLRFRKAAACGAELLLQSGSPTAGGSASPDSRQRLALEARAYLDEHCLLTWLQDLMQALITDKPSDPWSYISALTSHETETARPAQAVGKTQAAADPSCWVDVPVDRVGKDSDVSPGRYSPADAPIDKDKGDSRPLKDDLTSRTTLVDMLDIRGRLRSTLSQACHNGGLSSLLEKSREDASTAAASSRSTVPTLPTSRIGADASAGSSARSDWSASSSQAGTPLAPVRVRPGSRLASGAMRASALRPAPSQLAEVTEAAKTRLPTHALPSVGTWLALVPVPAKVSPPSSQSDEQGAERPSQGASTPLSERGLSKRKLVQLESREEKAAANSNPARRGRSTRKQPCRKSAEGDQQDAPQRPAGPCPRALAPEAPQEASLGAGGPHLMLRSQQPQVGDGRSPPLPLRQVPLLPRLSGGTWGSSEASQRSVSLPSCGLHQGLPRSPSATSRGALRGLPEVCQGSQAASIGGLQHSGWKPGQSAFSREQEADDKQSRCSSLPALGLADQSKTQTLRKADGGMEALQLLQERLRERAKQDQENVAVVREETAQIRRLQETPKSWELGRESGRVRAQLEKLLGR